MQCPECGYLISDLDEDCPRCHGLGSGAVYKHQRTRPSLMRPRATPRLTKGKMALILCVMLLPVGAAVITCLMQIPPSPTAGAPTGSAAAPAPSTGSAEAAATQFVSGGAGGAAPLEVRRGTVASQSSGDSEWVVTGEAEGVNAAGATIPLEWKCRVRRSADGVGWEVVEHDVEPAK